MTKPFDITTAQSYIVILRCIHVRGPLQKAALAELNRRGLWLTNEQQKQAGLGCAIVEPITGGEPKP